MKKINNNDLINNFVKAEELDENFFINADSYLVDIGDQIYNWFLKNEKKICIGINGAQGTGKSTISNFFKEYLKEKYNLSVIVISLDDLYKTKSDRELLSKKIHPLLKTRGVPGTHDIDLGYDSINSFLSDSNNDSWCPKFDKNTDDRCKREKWHNLNFSTDIVILEGWCVGASPQNDEDLLNPVNELEINYDKGCIWRTFVNESLKSDYQKLFNLCSYLIMLKPPSFESIYEWRYQQENKISNESSFKMNREEVINFVQYFQRLTIWMLDELPKISDVVVEFNKNHLIKRVYYKA
ncbi:MAG: P-loop NTPase fold protein [Verrucomicrobiota bacterium]|nr:P-loop NTPase fold protein [Verrucomicrobiota bacterium]